MEEKLGGSMIDNSRYVISNKTIQTKGGRLIKKIEKLAALAVMHFMLPTGVAINAKDHLILSQYFQLSAINHELGKSYNTAALEMLRVSAGTLKFYIKPAGDVDILIDADDELHIDQMKAVAKKSKN